MALERDDTRGPIAALLQTDQSGDHEVSDGLTSKIYQELRRIARDEVAGRWTSPGASAAARVNEVYARLVNEISGDWQDRTRFLVTSARAMRRTVVDHMRRHVEQRRSADHRPLALGAGETGTDHRAELILALDEALSRLEDFNARLVRVVECRYFAGFTEEETAGALRISVDETRRDWTRARAWLLRVLGTGLTSDSESDHAIVNPVWVDAVFDEALGLPSERRQHFLENCQTAPPELLGEVHKLLQLADLTAPGLDPGDLGPDLLWSILADGDLPVSSDLAAGQRVGPWRVLRDMERGRIGNLYRVERADGQSQQQGILTLVRSASVSDEIAHRLGRERRVLGGLRHPNIARYLDFGQREDGRVFFVVEQVDGRPIDRFCDEEFLTIEQRLDLFARLCTAIQHGHRELVVHGEIRPSNVVVSADRHLKVLDFGITGLLQPSRGDQGDEAAGGIGATPEYATPEQVRGDPVAVLSDVYQLGLLLYELLTGERAQTIATMTAAGVEHAVCATAPTRPSARVRSAPAKTAAARRVRPRRLARKLAGDLDAIVLRALRKEPQHRYASASALRSDVQRFRMGLPVWARRDTLGYRAGKFVVRHRAGLAIAAALLLLAAATLPSLAEQRLRAVRDATRAAQAEQVLAGMFPQPPSALGLQPPATPEYLERAATVARVQLASQPKAQAQLLGTIGRLYAATGRYDRSIDVLEEALVIRRANFGDDSVEVAETLEWLGQSRHFLGRYDEAETSLRDALAIRQVRFGASHPATLRTVVELGDLMHTRGRLLDAERMLRGAMGVLRPPAVAASQEAHTDESLPVALFSLADVLRDRGILGESGALYTEALSILRRHGPDPDPQVATAQIGLSQLLVMRSELDAAEATLAEALPALRGSYPGEHPLVAVALRDYGFLRMEQGRFDEAGDLFTQAERLQQRWLGHIHPEVPQTRAYEAELERRRGRMTEAVSLARQALEELDRLGLGDHPSAIQAGMTLGQALTSLGEYPDAVAALRPALSNAERLFIGYDPRIARIRDALARAAQGLPHGA